MTTKERKAWIENATYIELLHKWRFEPIGSEWFEGEIGTVFEERMRKTLKEVGPEGHVAASKAIGW